MMEVLCGHSSIKAFKCDFLVVTIMPVHAIIVFRMFWLSDVNSDNLVVHKSLPSII